MVEAETAASVRFVDYTQIKGLWLLMLTTNYYETDLLNEIH